MTWTDEGDEARLRGIQFAFAVGEPQAFGEQPDGTAEDEENFEGDEVFSRVDVYPTTALGGRVSGFVLYWTDQSGTRQRQFGIPGDLAVAQFNRPDGNVLSQILISSGLDIDSIGGGWEGGA
jgi:hypothetical protein